MGKQGVSVRIPFESLLGRAMGAVNEGRMCLPSLVLIEFVGDDDFSRFGRLRFLFLPRNSCLLSNI